MCENDTIIGAGCRNGLALDAHSHKGVSEYKMVLAHLLWITPNYNQCIIYLVYTDI